ncbi:YtxH domain-containing protein [Paenibacillus sp. 1001270B_150601_E10]|uniref:YtxH domain-containing protein n=1 Tax=Paenibacillus sp. 1001270B_150601_E10 TaxID=2787079 RepID=UPI00189CD03D|nr:YtxH domain-containing protein [Paenibacillus sp. 1001270B_150601_E10]
MASKNQQSFLIGALVGTIAGGVAALLFAPKPGRELRQDIAEGTKQATGKAQEVVKQVSERTVGFVESAKEKTAEWKQKLQSLREDDREDVLAQVSGVTGIELLDGEDEDTVVEAIEASVKEEDSAEDREGSFHI